MPRGNGHKSGPPLTPETFYVAVHEEGLHDQDDTVWCDCGWQTAVGSYEAKQLLITLSYVRQHARGCSDLTVLHPSLKSSPACPTATRNRVAR